ncbi:SubName: Full=Uncharacterized protein {ECO:0000313/EMBL:CCA69859.1} [Serendipita indica DSM 11827]|nr:SubName: Full=Uncharacterized protein {ECO:0000313/EMBL:CCA69859.1} [Serendipita indica DSM 11827]
MPAGPSPAPVLMNLPEGVTVDQLLVWTRTHLEGERLLLATIVFMVYDVILTFPEELEFIWAFDSWSVSKTLFIINRYFPIVHSIIRFWVYAHERDERLSALISVAVIEVVLMLRLWAMYARNKLFGAFLGFVFLTGIATALAIRKVQPPDDFKLVREAPQSLTICKRSSPSELFFLYAIILVVETMIFTLLLWKVWQLSAVGVAPILRTMLKHGTQYYLVVFVALFFQVLGTILQPLWQPMADSLLVVSVASVACSRLVLSLRGMYSTPQEVTTIQDFQANPPDPTSRTVRFSTLRSISGFKFRDSTSLMTDTTTTADHERNAIPLRRYRDSVQPPIEEEDDDWNAEPQRHPFAHDRTAVDSETDLHPQGRTWNAL